jgi:hypothetical protein
MANRDACERLTIHDEGRRRTDRRRNTDDHRRIWSLMAEKARTGKPCQIGIDHHHQKAWAVQRHGCFWVWLSSVTATCVGYGRRAFTNALDALEKGDMLYFVLCFCFVAMKERRYGYTLKVMAFFRSLLYFINSRQKKCLYQVLESRLVLFSRDYAVIRRKSITVLFITTSVYMCNKVKPASPPIGLQ